MRDRHDNPNVNWVDGEPEGLGEILMYESEDGQTRLEVQLDGETVWLTQAQIAELFGIGIPGISKHLKNIFEEGELEQDVVVSKMEIATQHGAIAGKTQKSIVNVYNLDAVISVGYRVNSKRATHFRRWATGVLRDYIVKGFALDDERLKRGDSNYWRELLDRIRDIRSSEKMLYRQVLDLYATAVDYDPSAEETVRFFKIVQNKLHFAAHGHTAAEIVFERADADKEFMGLTSFKGVQPTLADVRVAKNYLSERELKVLNNLVSAFFDLAELDAVEHRALYMRDYVERLDAMFSAAGRKILTDAGSRSHQEAMERAEVEYRKYQARTLSPVERAYFKALKEAASSSTD
ncbi:MAG: virulence RhuM family protein [Eggerthellaceae bacterium]|nr:virulence RhuM family protein [Eggerthellaceae bacterium]